MVSLFDLNDNLITEVVDKALPWLDATKIKNRLLNGQYHVQTIGKAVKMFSISCFVTETGKNTIDTAESIGEPIKLLRSGVYYTGLIMSTPQWNPVIDSEKIERSFTGQFTLAVNEEGDA